MEIISWSWVIEPIYRTPRVHGLTVYFVKYTVSLAITVYGNKTI